MTKYEPADDHVVDLLLDSAAMGGINVVEREGIFSFSHPARFILVGTMNPGRRRPAPAAR
ncbi:MAG: hypothetical protein U0694_13800 [Anaerolineae bacterium]